MMSQTTPAQNAGIQKMEQLTLGEISQHLELCEPDWPVRFGFGNQHPNLGPNGGINAYAGYHDTVALAHTDRGKPPKAHEVVCAINEAIGRILPNPGIFEYTVTKQTPVWVANPYQTSDAAIVRVEVLYEDEAIFIQTWGMPY